MKQIDASLLYFRMITNRQTMRSIALVLFGLALAQAQDLTQQAGASGAQVVESVVNLIHESCVFPNDRLLLKRMAFVDIMYARSFN